MPGREAQSRRVRSGSVSSIVAVSGATIAASPPVATTRGRAAARPFRPDPPHHAVHRVGRAVQHARLNAFLGAPSDHPRRALELGGRQLGGAPGELVGRGPKTGMIDAADETGRRR